MVKRCIVSLHGPAVQAINEFANESKLAFLSPVDQPVRNPAPTLGPIPKCNLLRDFEGLLAV